MGLPGQVCRCGPAGLRVWVCLPRRHRLRDGNLAETAAPFPSAEPQSHPHPHPHEPSCAAGGYVAPGRRRARGQQRRPGQAPDDGVSSSRATAAVNVRSSPPPFSCSVSIGGSSQPSGGEDGNGREVLGLAGRWSSYLLGHAARDGESRPQAAWSRSRCGSCPPLRVCFVTAFNRCRWQSCSRSGGGAGRPTRALHTLSS